jgi:hypothetical protein
MNCKIKLHPLYIGHMISNCFGAFADGTVGVERINSAPNDAESWPLPPYWRSNEEKGQGWITSYGEKCVPWSGDVVETRRARE